MGSPTKVFHCLTATLNFLGAKLFFFKADQLDHLRKNFLKMQVDLCKTMDYLKYHQVCHHELFLRILFSRTSEVTGTSSVDAYEAPDEVAGVSAASTGDSETSMRESVPLDGASVNTEEDYVPEVEEIGAESVTFGLECGVSDTEA